MDGPIQIRVDLLIFVCKDILQQGTIVDMFDHITISIWSFSWYSIRSDWINTFCIQLEYMAVNSLSEIT